MTSGSVTIDITWCMPWGGSGFATRTVTLNTVDVSGDFSYLTSGQDANCDYFEVWQGTVTLAAAPLNQQFRATAIDYMSYQGEDYVYYAIPAPWRGVLVSANDGNVTADASSTGNTQVFTVWNTGDVSATYSLSASCTGAATPSTCSLSTGTLTIGAGSSNTATVTYTASATPGDTAGIRVTATDDDEYTTTSTGYTAVRVIATPSAGITSVRSVSTIHRGNCVTVNVAPDAAMECGVLRLTHALPSTTTMGATRTPTLIYNSEVARPLAIVQADVTLGCSSLPSSVTVSVHVASTLRGSRTYNGSDWGSCSATRRVSIDVDMNFGSTSYLYGYTVSAAFGGTVLTDAARLISVVSRPNSPFGVGWWLAGLERLAIVNSSILLWTGGDGSTAYYVGGGGIYTTPEPFDRPDTITYNSSTAEYTRHGAGNVDVKFNSNGYHVSTTNRRGHVTRFTYLPGTDRLDSLILPVRSGTAPAYKFTYTSGLLDSVIAPSAGAPRNVKITPYIGTVAAIRDPDLSTVTYGFLSGANAYVINSKTDRRGNTTYFTYDAANRLAKDSLSLGVGVFIRQNLRPAETASLTVAAPIADHYTSIDGPRTDVNDETKIWVNQFGQPTRVRDPESAESAITYDATWPGLVKTMRSPSRMVTEAFYNARGLADSVKAWGPLGGSAAATTKYTYHSTFPFPVSVVDPVGVIDSMAYDSNGNRSWAQRGGSARRVTFTYTGDNLDSAVTLPSGIGSPLTRIAHNALGNVSSVTNPKGYVSFNYQNAIGQDTLVASPHSDTTNASSFHASYYTRVRKLYTIGGADSITTTFGPAVTLPSPYSTTVPADSLRLEHRYDAEGNPVRIRRQYNYGGDIYLVDSMQYDAANRLTWKSSPVSSTTLTLDGAGNVTASQNARGYTVSMTYDKANRLTRRVTPQVTYSSTSCSSLSNINWAYGCSYSLPTIGSSVCIDADTSRFTYDYAGRMTRAYNRYGQVERSYNPNGSLSNDNLRIRSLYEPGNTSCVTTTSDALFGGSEWSAHSYNMSRQYDMAGKVTSLSNPYALCGRGGSSTCTTSYTYSSTTGELTGISDGVSGSYSFAYDDGGRLRKTTYPSAYKDTVGLDLLGQTVWRQVISGSAISDVMRYDAAGRIIRGAVGVRDGVSYGSDVDTWYGPLGAVVASTGATTAQGGTTTEKFTVDALGNRRQTEAKNMRQTWHPDVDGIRNHSVSNSGQLASVVAPSQSSGFYSGKYLTYDASGNLTLTERQEMDYQSTSTVLWDVTAQYYDAGDKLRVLNRAVGPYANDDSHPGERNVFEEYWYDALGRRILTRSRRTGYCSTSASECESYVQRTVWDGDQVIIEQRAPGGTGESSTNIESNAPTSSASYNSGLGTVYYLHGAGIDQPLAVSRRGIYGNSSTFTVHPHTNWRGQYEIGHLGNGTICSISSACTYNIAWPGARTTIDGDVGAKADGPIWFGSLITGNTDGSGQTYLRNRYYDPATGRFTQEDPIGLAGGMNAYGFASGDRINFSDPFGLKQCPPDCGGLGSLLGVFAASGVPATAPNGPPIMRIGVTGSLGSLSGSCKLGGSCGGAVNLTPQFGASIDVAIPYRSAGANEWGGSVGYGVNKHLGVSFSNEEFGASLGLGVGAPVSISVTPPSSPAANPEGVPTVRPDVTAVRRKPPSL